MKIKIQKDAFLKALQKVGNTVSTRNTLPILANILFVAEDGKLTLTATDNEMRVETTVEAEVEEAGSITIPAKKILTLVSKFRSPEVIIEGIENFHSKVRCGSTSAMLVGLDPQNYPEKKENEITRSFKIKQSDFATIIDRISYATCIQDSRKVLQGIFVSMKDGKFTAVATDGKRLALCEKILENEEQNAEANGDMIIPLKPALELKRLMEKDGDLEVQASSASVQFVFGNTVLTTKTLEGNYPNYRQVVPASFATIINVPRDGVLYALDLLSSTFMETTSPSINLCFEDNNLLFELNSTVGEGKENLPIEYTGEKLSVIFNTNFLIDPFRHLDCDVITFKFNDVMSPIAIETADGFMYIIMPLRNRAAAN